MPNIPHGPCISTMTADRPTSCGDIQTLLIPATMDDPDMPSFLDSTELYSMSSRSYTLSPTDGHFDVSFGLHTPINSNASFDSDTSLSSSVSSFDQCFTPVTPRRSSYDAINLDELPSCPTSVASSVSNSRTVGGMFHAMGEFSLDKKARVSSGHDIKNRALEFAPVYNTLLSGNVRDQPMTSFEYSKVSDIYGNLDLHQTVNGISEITYGSLPRLSYSCTPSVQLGLSPVDFVVPSQTFNRNPYRPNTPGDTAQTQLPSPLVSHGRPWEASKYFMSPPSHKSSPLRNVGSPSPALRNKKSSKRAVETSRVLHRLQDFGSHRIEKQPKRSQQVPASIKRVAAGAFYCDIEGCKSKQAFKRHEHLKRHRRTHDDPKELECPFCQHRFANDRADNYRTHVNLHAQRAPRTKYYEEAEEMVKKWKMERELKKSGLNKVHTRRVRSKP